MSDALDTQIRTLVIQLVDAAPPAPSLHELEHKEHIRALAGEFPREPEGPVKAHFGPAGFGNPRCWSHALPSWSWQASSSSGAEAAHRRPTDCLFSSGTWRLADDELSGTWSQYTHGPPCGLLTCPSTSICYVMSGHYKTPYSGAPLLGVSLYASSDEGQSWTAHPMPNGFAPTSQLAVRQCIQLCCWRIPQWPSGPCYDERWRRVVGARPTPRWCRPSRHVVVPLVELLCRPRCKRQSLSSNRTKDATFLVSTNGGKMFIDRPLVSGDSMQSLSCSSDQDCTAIGWRDDPGGPETSRGALLEPLTAVQPGHLALFRRASARIGPSARLWRCRRTAG